MGWEFNCFGGKWVRGLRGGVVGSCFMEFCFIFEGAEVLVLSHIQFNSCLDIFLQL